MESRIEGTLARKGGHCLLSSRLQHSGAVMAIDYVYGFYQEPITHGRLVLLTVNFFNIILLVHTRTNVLSLFRSVPTTLGHGMITGSW